MESETGFVVNPPDLSAILPLAVLVLLTIGVGEKSNLDHRTRFIGTGTLLLGVVVYLAPLSVFMTLI
jgi:hypothetical protein